MLGVQVSTSVTCKKDKKGHSLRIGLWFFFRYSVIDKNSYIVHMATSDMHRCSLCSFFCCKQDDFLNHIVRRHRHDANFIVHCSSAASGVSFSNFRSFKNHVQRRHPEHRNAENDRDDNSDSARDSEMVVDRESECREESTASAEAAYILSLKSKHRLSQSAVMDN